MDGCLGCGVCGDYQDNSTKVRIGESPYHHEHFNSRGWVTEWAVLLFPFCFSFSTSSASGVLEIYVKG